MTGTTIEIQLLSFQIFSIRLGRILVPEDHYGKFMSQWVINNNGNALTRKTLHSLNVGEIIRDTEEQNHKDFYAKIKLKLGDSLSPSKNHIGDQETYADYTKE